MSQQHAQDSDYSWADPLDEGAYLRLEDVPELDELHSSLGPGMRSFRPISPFRGMPGHFKKLFEKLPPPPIPYSPQVLVGAKREVLVRRKIVPSQTKPKSADKNRTPISSASCRIKRDGASFMSGKNESANFAKLAFEGAVFVFVGGFFGIVFAELLTPRESIAAPSNAEMTGGMVAAPQPFPAPMMVDPCGDAVCGMAMPVPAPPQVIYLPVQPPTVVVVKETPPKVKKRAVASAPCCHHRHKAAPKAVVKRHKPKPTPAEAVVVAPPPPPKVVFPIVSPPPAMMPVPAPVYVNPCLIGECAPGCEDMSMLDIKGPCSGPNAASCVQRISFNEDGDATRAVLEQRFGSEMGPHFEYGAANLRVEGPVWSQTPNSLPATGAAGESPVSFVMPFVNTVSATHPAPSYMPGQA